MCFNNNIEFDNQSEYTDFEYEQQLDKALDRAINGENQIEDPIESFNFINSIFSCFSCFF
jgi:hypothetical protein